MWIWTRPWAGQHTSVVAQGHGHDGNPDDQDRDGELCRVIGGDGRLGEGWGKWNWGDGVEGEDEVEEMRLGDRWRVGCGEEMEDGGGENDIGEKWGMGTWGGGGVREMRLGDTWGMG